MAPLESENGEPCENNGSVDPKSDDESDKKVSEWKRSLPQIGWLANLASQINVISIIVTKRTECSVYHLFNK